MHKWQIKYLLGSESESHSVIIETPSIDIVEVACAAMNGEEYNKDYEWIPMEAAITGVEYLGESE